MIESIEEHDVHIDLRESIHASVHNGAEFRTEFTLRLCKKQTALGDLPLDQWWISKQGIYGERNNASPNRQTIVECFWSLCQAAGSDLTDRRIQESYSLATLLPHARSNGSRRIFVDASLAKVDKESELDRRTVVARLDSMLKQVQGEELDVPSFYRQTGDVLGPPEYEDQVQKCYGEFVEEILGDPQPFPRDPKVKTVIRHPITELKSKQWLVSLWDRTFVFDPATSQARPFGDGRVHGLIPIVQTPKGTFISGAGIRSTDYGKIWQTIDGFPDIKSQGWRHEMVCLKNGWLLASEILGPGFGGERIRYRLSYDDGQTWDSLCRFVARSPNSRDPIRLPGT